MLNRIKCRILKIDFFFNVGIIFMEWSLFLLYPTCMIPLYTGIIKLEQWVVSTLLSVQLALYSSSVDYPLGYYLWLFFTFGCNWTQCLVCPIATLTCSEYVVNYIGSTIFYRYSVFVLPFRPCKMKTIQYEGFLLGSAVPIFRIVKKLTSSADSFSLIHLWFPWFS